MTKRIRPPDTADVTLFMRMLFLRTERDIVNEIRRKRGAGLVDYAEAAALERVQAILQNMVDESWAYVPVMIEKIFYHSDKDAAGYANARALTVTQLTVVEQLSNNLLGEITEAASVAEKSVQDFFTIARLENDPFRQTALKQVLMQQAQGKPWIQASQQMVREMENQGIPAFVDKAGRTWSLQSYGNMAVRTTARQAQVAALLTADDHDLWQIVKIGSTCPVCAALEGRIYSKSGTNPDYPPLTLAFGKVDPSGSDDLTNTYLNIHPNCLHSLIKYTTIGKTEKQIQKDKDFSDPEKNPLNRDPRTKKQIKAYREKERNRQRLLREKRKQKALKDDTYQKQKKKEKSSESPLTDAESPMHLKLPDDILKVNGMTTDRRIEIEKAITVMQKKYDIKIGEIAVESAGPMEKHSIMIAGPYLDSNRELKMGLVINADIDYNSIDKVIADRYANGYFASKNISDAVAHEMAHILTFQDCRTLDEYKTLRKKIKDLYTPGISGYSDRTRDGAETLAEAFVRMKNKEKVPLSVRLAVKKYVTGR